MQLYDYQKQYLATMPESGIMHADLGTGKTAMSLMHWGQQHKLLVVAPASKIRTGDWQEEAVAWLGHELAGDITYISYESLRLMDKDTRRPRWWKYTGARNGGIVYDIIADECLTGETLITTNKGLKEIADIQNDDVVLSHNDKTGILEYKKVTKVIKRKTDDKLYLVFYDGGAIISTYNHPHYVNGEYKIAKDIKIGDYLEQLTDDDTTSSQEAATDENAHSDKKVWCKSHLFLVQKDGKCRRDGCKAGTTSSRKEYDKLVLFRSLRQASEQYQSARTRNKTSQNVKQPLNSSQSQSNSQEERNGYAYMGTQPATPTLKRWEWQNYEYTAKVISNIDYAWTSLGFGTSGTNAERGRQWISQYLQTGYRQSIVKYWNRAGRRGPQQQASQMARQKKGQTTKRVRVESIAILEQADIERLGYVREPNYVYCIEVEDNHNFFANGILTHNCQSIKNPQSKQAKAVYEICQSGGQFIGLSGTPMSNGWIDFAGYSKLFGFTKGITEFKQKYCNINTFAGFPRIVGYFNTEEMNRQWHLVSRSLTREQAHELPDRQFIGKTIMLNPKEQKDYYNAKIVRTTKTGELLDNPSLLLNYLRQVGVASRLDVLSDILDDTSENIVIFYNYISERKAILEYIAKYHKDKKVLRYDGEKHSTLPKSDAQLKNTVLVAHYKSASTGLNLQWATVTVFFSLTYSYQEFEQSIGRTHRTGQTKKCVFYIFKAKNTVDEDIYAALRDKKDFSTKLWGAEQ